MPMIVNRHIWLQVLLPQHCAGQPLEDISFTRGC
jgi:hypothetical protein